jgi:voltage-gated potassium channel
MKKVLIFGYTKTGREIAKVLKNDEFELSIVDENPLQVGEANRDGFFARHSTAQDDDMLKSMGIGEDVEALFCVSNDESLNLFVTLSARNLDKNLKILTLVRRKEDEKKMLLAGANRIISPYILGAIKAFRIIQKPKVSKVLDQISRAKRGLVVTEIEIIKDSVLDGVYFSQSLEIKETNLVFLGILDKKLGEEFIFFYKGIKHKMNDGDILVALGHKATINAFKNKISKKVAK